MCFRARPTPKSSPTWSTACTTATCLRPSRPRCSQLHGAYAIAVFCKDEPHRLIGARAGSPLILGVGKDGQEHFLASDAMALAGVTDQIVYLDEGDVVDMQLGKYWLLDKARKPVAPEQRPVKTVQAHSGAAELGPYRHYMQKEIFEQPRAIADTLEGVDGIVPELFDGQATPPAQRARVFADIDSVLILACGTSYYSGCTAKYWLESIAKIPTQVEVASEYRYRDSVPNPKHPGGHHHPVRRNGRHPGRPAPRAKPGHDAHPDHLQRGHQCHGARMRAGLHHPRRRRDWRGLHQGLHHPAGGPVPADAGAGASQGALERGGRSTTPQSHAPPACRPASRAGAGAANHRWAEDFAKMENALFLGRGLHYPIALEGALKLKEISYIHAEAYPAGELKHGPLALVTSAMPVVTVAPNDALLEKLKSNMHEVRARGGVLYVLADADTRIESGEGLHVIRMPEHYETVRNRIDTVRREFRESREVVPCTPCQWDMLFRRWPHCLKGKTFIRFKPSLNLSISLENIS